MILAVMFAIVPPLFPASLKAQTNPAGPTASEHKSGNDPLKFEEIAPGVGYASCELKDDQIFYQVVRVDLSQKEARIGVVKPSPSDRNGKASVSAIAAQITTGKEEAVAVMNGDYYDNGTIGPWGIHLQDGRMFFSPTGKSAFLIDKNGAPSIDIPSLSMTVQFGDATNCFEVLDMNRPTNIQGRRGLHLFAATKLFGEIETLRGAALIQADLPFVDAVVTGMITTVISQEQNRVSIPEKGLVLNYNGDDKDLPARLFQTGTAVRIRTTLVPACFEAIGGGPTILRNGQVAIGYDTETFGQGHASYLKGRHPRSVAGLTQDRKILFMVLVEGRTKRSKGMLPEETARLMLDLGAWNALMFDGGASSTLHKKGHPVAGEVRKHAVCNGLAVFVKRQADKP